MATTTSYAPRTAAPNNVSAGRGPVAFGRCVNLTVGLPIIRTSVDHGTAYDIVGTGQADPHSLLEAIKLARQLIDARGVA